MPNYRRAFISGGTWFFAANLLERQHNDLLVRDIELLRCSVQRVRKRHPFRVDAWVVLPEQLHAVWTLAPSDDDFEHHVDYVHVNPLTHGYVKRVVDWPYSTFHRDALQAIYPLVW